VLEESLLSLELGTNERQVLASWSLMALQFLGINRPVRAGERSSLSSILDECLGEVFRIISLLAARDSSLCVDLPWLGSGCGSNLAGARRGHTRRPRTDLLNSDVCFLECSRERVRDSFQLTEWHRVRPIGLEESMRIGESCFVRRRYPEGQPKSFASIGNAGRPGMRTCGLA
jgi:hypothetical protein